MRPLVSIIIPCYNQGQFLAEAIESALGQSYPAREVLVIDDGSTDATAAVAARYAPHLRYLWQANGGLSAARNRGILEARGEFVLFLDADDYLAPDLLERHMAVAAASPEGTSLYGVTREVDLTGRVLSHSQAQLGTDPFHRLLLGNCFAIHSVMVRRQVFAEVGLFDVSLKACEDWDLWLRLASAGHEFVAVPDAVAVYRRYPGSMSAVYARMWPAGLAVLQKSKTYHEGCGQCRQVRTMRLRTWRRWCFEMLAKELIACGKKGDWRSAVGEAAGAVRRDPLLAGLFLEWFLSLARIRGGRLLRRRRLRQVPLA